MAHLVQTINTGQDQSTCCPSSGIRVLPVAITALAQIPVGTLCVPCSL